MAPFVDLYAKKAVKGKFNVPGHGEMKLDIKEGERLPGELQSWPVVKHLNLGDAVQDKNAPQAPAAAPAPAGGKKNPGGF